MHFIGWFQEARVRYFNSLVPLDFLLKHNVMFVAASITMEYCTIIIILMSILILLLHFQQLQFIKTNALP